MVGKRRSKNNDRYFEMIETDRDKQIKTNDRQINKIMRVTIYRNEKVQERIKCVKEYREAHKKVYNLSLEINDLDSKINEHIMEMES